MLGPQIADPGAEKAAQTKHHLPMAAISTARNAPTPRRAASLADLESNVGNKYASFRAN
jgi:hypothetical protein